MQITSISEWLRITDEQRRALLAGPDAAAWIEALARYGFAEAQTLYGQLLLDRPHKAAPGSAFGWFAAAADADHPPAINMMGRCLEHGWDVVRDPGAAAACYRRAAETGYDWAEYNLGCVLLYGIGTPRDRVEAFAWFSRAAAQGLAKAMNMLGRFHEEGWDRQASRQTAARWYQDAAERGDYRGMFNLAALLHRQNRVAEAVRHVRAAIDIGNLDFLADVAQLLGGNDDPLIRALGTQAAQRREGMLPIGRTRN
jgi:TPR repeat protein